jgi:hypothetical protein
MVWTASRGPFHRTSRPVNAMSLVRGPAEGISPTSTAMALGRILVLARTPIRCAVAGFWTTITDAVSATRLEVSSPTVHRTLVLVASSSTPRRPNSSSSRHGDSTAPPTGPHTSGLFTAATPVRSHRLPG